MQIGKHCKLIKAPCQGMEAQKCTTNRCDRLKICKIKGFNNPNF